MSLQKNHKAAGNSNWVKGISGNPNGRKKGAKNKVTKESKEKLLRLISKVGGEKEYLKLYKDHEWAKKLLWDVYFGLIPKKSEVDTDIKAVFKWVGENDEPDHNGPV